MFARPAAHRRLALSAMVSLALSLAPVAVVAVQPDEILKDPALEARARHLSGELRCLVCQNQSIDDSDAPLARDLRILVRERLTAGDSDAQVKSFLVARYGEFVLLRPAVSARTIPYGRRRSWCSAWEPWSPTRPHAAATRRLARLCR